MAEWDWILGVFLDLNTNFKRFNAGSNRGEFVVGRGDVACKSTDTIESKRKRQQIHYEKYMKSKGERLGNPPKPADFKLLAMENPARLARAGHLPSVAGLQTEVEAPFCIPCADFVDDGNTATGALASPLAQAPLHVVGPPRLPLYKTAAVHHLQPINKAGAIGAGRAGGERIVNAA
ncbi:hypothetical protein R3P38DRAFT_2793801 [Favolaschia claudopus]|uniref:Uncharacterized protein n=1 Tax=Favolaschia claudopus TaxID=2862362 RepID=A0AAW0ACZ5_9AGAR